MKLYEKNESITPAAILFDMDGVLVDSLDSWWKSLNDALQHFKQETITKEEFIDNYWGNELQENLKKLGLDEKIGVFCNNIYGEYLDNVKVFPGVCKTLEKLEGYPKAIITNTPRDCTLQILEKFDIKNYFDAIITSDQIENGKPAPDIIFEACTQLGVEPRDAALIGDTDNDMAAGKTAGCNTIGIKVKGDFTLQNISDLTKVIEPL